MQVLNASINYTKDNNNNSNWIMVNFVDKTIQISGIDDTRGCKISFLELEMIDTLVQLNKVEGRNQ